MGATPDQIADDKATQTAETTSTATTDTSSEGKEETSEDLSQEEADKQILDEMQQAEKDKAKEDGEDVADDTDETKPDENKSEDETQTAESEEETEKRAKGAEARKEQLTNEIRSLVSERDKVRKELEADIEKAYRTQTQEELEEEGLSPEEAENEKLKQDIQMRDYKQHVTELNQTLNLQALQVMQDFPQFDPQSPQFDKSLAQRVGKLYDQASGQQIDKKTGLVTRSNIAPYEFYKAFAETAQMSGEKSRAEGRVEGQKAADKELAAAETKTSAPPAKSSQKEDPFLKGLLSADD